MSQIFAEVQALRDEVARTQGVAASSKALILGLVAKVDALVANATDLEALKAELTQMTTTLDATNDDLAAAVDANDGEPAPVDEEPPAEEPAP